VKIPLIEILATPREIDFAARFNQLDMDGVRFLSPVDVHVSYHRSGNDLFFDGNLGADVEGVCSRCLNDYCFRLEKKFDLVLIPDTLPTNKNRKLNRDEMGLSYYQGEEVDLLPLVHEQALLGVPLRPLCNDSCRGLCPGCGADRNAERCDCDVSPVDSRMAVFRQIRVGR